MLKQIHDLAFYSSANIGNMKRGSRWTDLDNTFTDVCGNLLREILACDSMWHPKDSIQEKLHQTLVTNDKGYFIQDYCNGGKRVNSTLLKQKARAF